MSKSAKKAPAKQRGDAGTLIARTAAEVEADLVVLGTHAKAGMEAFWSASVAPKVSSLSHVPLLLVPAVPGYPDRRTAPNRAPRGTTGP
ncbi:MAG: hypothetical protein COZ06_25195 [Armatimonadetes bacterium CG_4_10_14_3_um_filter_66_18]|nr:universal stress protein [Armatimonadota bacterium]PIU95149.1 MAG: hypothetical protein COS65_03960 [Armatimonadetes bacterium CG06_land_8_20_14_3_00_66_21]PIX41138.1 MAG: hypothetical protein COZ57_24230 [Armatimonadetes bacterium CG_4_8_14_3_um_filter_66_20]PIY42507.1 MAG: hypothetical protein COZ06_25195 [Armatimonadetes bacterium CG_4_10_14_3_um_filter_66_18]PIZ44313.1 MAG: hypothetical protein COY42_14205 [Armatimonadetes bacterium CG_4_10_14_0_8_um_filter_66_14]